ncbi:MAG: hypothetical protein ACD_87C00136G0008 [uncultured bacterium]|nr:MAG: hypothetical protein ACD_87C00136G0008 [uncultured bacterium]
MGNLTGDMTRLRGEVDALRNNRRALMQDLTRGARELTTVVAAMRADFTSAHDAMAKQTREERGAFVAAVINEVNSLLGAFSRERDEMARKGRHDRGVFLVEMRRQVTGMCKDTADDLMGARLAWRGRSSGKSRPVPVKEEPVVEKPLSPPVETALKETVAAPEVEEENPSATYTEPLEKEGEKETVVAAPHTPTVTPTQAENLDEKSAKAATKAKRGGKYTRSGF